LFILAVNTSRGPFLPHSNNSPPPPLQCPSSLVVPCGRPWDGHNQNPSRLIFLLGFLWERLESRLLALPCVLVTVCRPADRIRLVRSTSFDFSRQITRFLPPFLFTVVLPSPDYAIPHDRALLPLHNRSHSASPVVGSSRFPSAKHWMGPIWEETLVLRTSVFFPLSSPLTAIKLKKTKNTCAPASLWRALPGR